MRLDPNFAIAWAMLSRVNSWFYQGTATAERRAATEQSLETALRLQPESPEVQLAQAFYQVWVIDDYKAARQSFERLRASLPNSAEVLEGLYHTSVRLGRWDEARGLIDEAVALSPRDRIMRYDTAWIRESTRDFSAALRCYDDALKIWPDNHSLLDGKASVYQLLGQLDAADLVLKKVHSSSKEDFADTICLQAILRRRPATAIPLLKNWLQDTSALPVSEHSYYLELLGDLYRLSGNTDTANIKYSEARDEVEQALKEQSPNVVWIDQKLAWAYAGLGDSTRALMLIDRAMTRPKAAKSVLLAAWCEDTRARIAARFGMNDVAIPILERLLHLSYNDPLTPAVLRLHPDFDPLRGDPRFEKLAHSDGK